MKRPRLLLAALLPFSFAGVCDPGSLEVQPEVEERFSFEADLEGWSVAASGLGEPPAAWGAGRSTDQAFAGDAAVSLSLDNATSQGRVFLRRRFDIAPATDYAVELSFALGTADEGTANLWNLVAGVGRDAPSGGGLVTIGDTGGGAGGLQWVQKTASLDLRTGPDSGRLWIGLGIWGTSAFAREYFIDDVSVRIRRR